jgi:dTDP-4-dehydrorhamnose 3,5-epimerase
MVLDRQVRWPTTALSIKGDERGSLIAIEQLAQLPFEIARVYYIFGTLPEVTRGFHSHKTLHQFAVAVAGSCVMILDDGAERERVALDRPDVGIHIPPDVWHEMEDFSPDCVLLVIASAPYDEADYIRDYQDFLMSVGQAR